jgi:hypothetical protein
MRATQPSLGPHHSMLHTLPDPPSLPPLSGWISSSERRDGLSWIARSSSFRRIVRRSLQAWGDLHDALMTGMSHHPHPLARAQALDTWTAGRERAIEKLIREAEALEEHDPVEEAACPWHAVLRLRESARQERAQATALRATWSRKTTTLSTRSALSSRS